MNREHLKIVRKGVAAIEEWVQNHPEQTLNLNKANLAWTDLREANLSKARLSWALLSMASLARADLSEADLSHARLYNSDLRNVNLIKADLSGAFLMNADLEDADLSGANLHGANIAYAGFISADLRDANLSRVKAFETIFSGANLSGASFSNADLAYANLTFANLFKTDLSSSELTGVKFIASEMSGAKLTGATMGNTTFAACDLTKCVGLETVKHKKPSNIDFRTLGISFREAGNRLTSKLEIFLLNSGLPKDFLQILPKILAEVKYCSSFVCYGHPDLKFAKKLKKDLMARGVSCWLYSLDATPGERTWREIVLRRREAEKMIVLCSAKALIRDGVLKEIEEQIDEDPNKLVPISLDDTWRQNGFLVKRGQRDLKLFLLERNYADFSDKSKYDKSLLKLLKGLERKNS